MKNAGKKISIFMCYGIAAVYILVLAKLVLFKYGLTNEFRGISFIPFSFLIDFVKGNSNLADMLKNALGNVGVFIPLGILVPVLFNKFNLKMSILIGMFTSIWIEIFQYITGLGLTDIDDVILNTTGAAIGVFLYFKISRNIDKKFKNYFATVIMLCLLGTVSAGALYYFGFGSNLAATPVTVVNAEVLDGLDAKSADVEVGVEDINDNEIIAKPYLYDEEGKRIDSELETYCLNDQTRCFTSTFTYDYSPNGNVRSMTITYNEITTEELKRMFKEKEYHMELWLADENQCKNIIVTIYEER